MTDQEERSEEERVENEPYTPPLSGEPDENPPDLEEHLKEEWEGPATSEDESPIEPGEELEAESEEFAPPEEEVLAESDAVEDVLEEQAAAVLDDEEEQSIAELATDEAEAEADLAEELDEVAGEPAADLEPDELQEPEVETVETPGLDELQASLRAAESDEDELEEEEDDGRYWYVIHCYSGQENKVRHNLEQRIDTMGMKDRIFDVVVPTEEEIEVKDGKRRTVERRVFPGYILVQMILTEDSWYVVRNTPGVTGFVGMGNEPTPLRPEEVSQIIKRMEAEAPRIKVTYKIGQKVRIIDGPFNDFIGTVDDIDMERAKVRVMVSFFGRETPVELDFLQVEKA
jgi:transcriptional antiterminator NusG